MRKVALILFVVLVGFGSAASVEIVVNPSFEIPAGGGVQYDSADPNLNETTDIGWDFSYASGVFVSGDPELGGATVPNGNQAGGIFFEVAYYPAEEQNIYQDFIAGFQNGDQIEISWKQALGQNVGYDVEPMRFSVWWHRIYHNGVDGSGNLIMSVDTSINLFNESLDSATFQSMGPFTRSVSGIGVGSTIDDTVGYRLEFRPYEQPDPCVPDTSWAYGLIDAITVNNLNVWERNEVNLLSGFRNMYNPHVIKVSGDTYPYKMFFFGWATAESNPGYPGSDAIFTARSQSLDGSWQVYSGANGWQGDDQISLWVPIITADNKYYDQWHNGDPSVVYKDGTYYMAYSSTGFDLDGYQTGHDSDTDGDIGCIMGATSTDGINWTKSAAPILIYTPEVGQMEHVGDLMGDFHRPSLMWDEDHWRLWFDYWAPGVALAHAECYGNPMDSADWTITHNLSSPLLDEWPNPDVVRLGDKYYSVSDPGNWPPQHSHSWMRRQIAQAISDDGINWEILGWLVPDSDSPANHVPELYIEEISGDYWMYIFYACQIGGDPTYDYRYDRIRYMRQTIKPIVKEDFNQDGVVDFYDLKTLTDNWLIDTRPRQ